MSEPKKEKKTVGIALKLNRTNIEFDILYSDKQINSPNSVI